MGMHVCRSWSPPDPFAPECGCEVLQCGHVDIEVATTARCEQHGINAAKAIRSGHDGARCPAAPIGDAEAHDAPGTGQAEMTPQDKESSDDA